MSGSFSSYTRTCRSQDVETTILSTSTYFSAVTSDACLALAVFITAPFTKLYTVMQPPWVPSTSFRCRSSTVSAVIVDSASEKKSCCLRPSGVHNVAFRSATVTKCRVTGFHSASVDTTSPATTGRDTNMCSLRPAATMLPDGGRVVKARGVNFDRCDDVVNVCKHTAKPVWVLLTSHTLKLPPRSPVNARGSNTPNRRSGWIPTSGKR